MTENLTATIRKVRREQVQTSAELAYPASGCSVGWASANAGMTMRFSGRAR
jgi:hypothetical protein